MDYIFGLVVLKETPLPLTDGLRVETVECEKAVSILLFSLYRIHDQHTLLLFDCEKSGKS